LRICRIRQYRNNIGDDKPPFIVVNGAADFLSLEQGDVGFGVLAGVIHGLFARNHSRTRSPIASLFPVGKTAAF
jgi:hypothetical protein